MHGKTRLVLSLLVCASVASTLTAADNTAKPSSLSVAQIIDKNLSARGGAQAWQAVKTLSASGKIEAGSGDSLARSLRVAQAGMGPKVKGAQAAAAGSADKAAANTQVLLPFKLELKSPHMSRLEIEFAGQTAVQTYDGKNGWKVRPYLNRNEVEPFTADEAKAAETSMGDPRGPLVDYAANGIKVDLDGTEPVEGHPAYKLKLTLANGDTQHIWIDAQSFLDVKIEGAQHRMDGRMRDVWIYQRDFRTVQGLKMPFVYETAVDGVRQTHKMIVETFTVNHPIDDSRFGKPQLPSGAPVVAAPAASAPAPSANTTPN